MSKLVTYICLFSREKENYFDGKSTNPKLDV